MTTTFVQLLITSFLVTGASWLTQRALHFLESLEFPQSPDSEEKEALCPAVSDSHNFRKNSIVQHVNANPNGAALAKLGWREAREVLPLAVVFFAKVLLENLFLSYVLCTAFTDPLN